MRSAPAASRIRSLKAPAKPCSAQKRTSPRRVDRAALSCRSDGSRETALPMACGDDQGVAVDGRKLVAGLLGAGGGDAAHGVDHSPELPDALDPRGDIGKALGHGAALLSGDGMSGATVPT